VASGQGFRKRPKIFRAIDPVRSWSSVPEGPGPLISQQRDFRHFVDRGFERERRNACIAIPRIAKAGSTLTLSTWSQSGGHVDEAKGGARAVKPFSAFRQPGVQE
jgi:hypothetical protein